MTLLDHLTRGRVILGVGPGALASDALMFGIKPERQREMMDESLGVIVRLFESTTPLTVKSDWFELNEAVLQLRPYQQPFPIAVASVQSPAGVIVAGKYGAGVLSLSIPRDTVRQTSLKELWAIGEETAEKHGKTLRREDWSLVVSVHLAESRKEAIEDVRLGSGREVTEYFGATLGIRRPMSRRIRWSISWLNIISGSLARQTIASLVSNACKKSAGVWWLHDPGLRLGDAGKNPA